MSTAILDLFPKTNITTPTSKTVLRAQIRLDAACFSADSTAAQSTLTESGISSERLGELADVHCSGVRERTFVEPVHGIPLLTGSTLDVTTDDDIKFVSRVFTRNLETEKLIADDILISSAGTVGKADFVHRNHENRLASQDVIRIRPKSTNPPAGYLYAVLTSQLARRLIVSQPAGSVIVRIYEENVESLPIPRIPPATETKIARLIIKSFDARADARSLLAEADKAVLACNALPALNREHSSRHSVDDEPVHMTLTLKTVQNKEGGASEYRLDAHFYNPTAQQAVSNIKKCPNVKTLGDLAEVVFTGGRFKRNYVESDRGVPFLSGKNIVQIRPTDLKYLSNIQMADLPELLLKKASTLVTRSGTIGRTCFVWKNYEEYAASEHILRVIPHESEIDPGYLYAFLSSHYGYKQILRYRHGSVIDEITDKQIEQVLVPLPFKKQQTAIGDKVREAYEKRAEAIRLEDEAQAILMKELTKATGIKGA